MDFWTARVFGCQLVCLIILIIFGYWICLISNIHCEYAFFIFIHLTELQRLALECRASNVRHFDGRRFVYGRHLDGQVYMGVGGSLTGRLLPIDPEAEQTGGRATATGQVVMGKDSQGRGSEEETFPLLVQSVPRIISQVSGQLSLPILLCPNLLM